MEKSEIQQEKHDRDAPVCMISAEAEHYIGEFYRKSLLLMACLYWIQNVNSLLLFKNKNIPQKNILLEVSMTLR